MHFPTLIFRILEGLNRSKNALLSIVFTRIAAHIIIFLRFSVNDIEQE